METAEPGVWLLLSRPCVALANLRSWGLGEMEGRSLRRRRPEELRSLA